MQKKIVVIVLTTVMLLLSYPFTSVFATNCQFEFTSSQNVTGYIDVTVSIKSNPGIASFLLKVYFDNKKLVPYSVMRGAVLPISGTFSNNLAGADLSSLTYVQTYFVNGPSFNDITADGALYTIRFKIKDGADGRVVFYLDNNCEVINQSEMDVSFTSNAGRFTITEYPVEIMITNTNLSLSNGTWNGSIEGLVQEKSDAAPKVSGDNTIILAAYNSSNKLIYTKVATVESLNAAADKPFTINDISISAAASQGINLKLFLWNSALQMKPIAESDSRIITAPKRGVQ